MKNSKYNDYGSLSAADLRLLLKIYDQLETEEAELNRDVIDNPRINSKMFDRKSQQFVWAPYYDLTFPICVQTIIKQFGIAEDMKEIAKAENQVEALNEWMEHVRNEDDEDDDLTPNEWLHLTRFYYALVRVLMNNLRSLMVYGCYLNELVAVAREGKIEKRDKALFDAIRIDPTVVGCQTGIARISRAVLMRDAAFLNDLQNALNGKLGAKEQANFKKMRLVLQVLHEAKADRLSDNQLMVLFVKKLNLYHAPASAEKNLGEFARNFRNKKSTI